MQGFPSVTPLAIGARILVHQTYFKHGEHHLQAFTYAQIALSAVTVGAGLPLLAKDLVSYTSAEALSFIAYFFGGLYSSLVVYRLFYHPLNKFAGSLWARLSSLWLSVQVRNGDGHRQITRLHEQYGEFIRVGSSDLSITHPKGVTAIYGPRSACVKGVWYELTHHMVSLQTTRDKQTHKQCRRIWSEAFSDSALRSYEARMKTYRGKLMMRIHGAAASGEALDMTKWFNFYTFDTMGDLAFGSSFNMLDTSEQHWAIHILEHGPMLLSYHLPPWFFRFFVALPMLGKNWFTFVQYCADMIKKRIESPKDVPDIMSSLIKPWQEKQGSKPIPEEGMKLLQGDSQLIIVAGSHRSDSTAATMTHVIYELMKHPEHMNISGESLRSGRYVDINHKLHRQYGPVVRVGPSELSFIRADAWKHIYVHNMVELPKDPHFYGKPVNGVDHIGTADRTDHGRLRRIFSHAFSDRALRRQEPLFRKYAESMVQRMRRTAEQNTGRVNMADMHSFAAFDITAELAFGQPLHLFETGEYTPWVRTLLDGVKYMAIRGALEKVPLISQTLHRLTDGSLRAQFEAHFRFSSDLVNQRLAATDDNEAKLDIWSFALKHRESPKSLSLEEMHSNASGFMIGVGETTSTTLSSLLYFLLRTPQAMERVVAELQTLRTNSGGVDTSWSSLLHLDYMSACIAETLRLYPPAAVGLPRIVPPGGATVCNDHIPAGTTVYVSPYAASRSWVNFHRPEEFIPERWLGNNGDFASDQRDAYQPFSYGPRSCIGKHLAYYEIRLMLSHTLLNFMPTLSEESSLWTRDQKVWITWMKPPLWVHLERRESTQEWMDPPDHPAGEANDELPVYEDKP
ncbi:hypothetical protein S40288_01033 [Stachybotrys chartarum IBT 40288]|nr:hypothetical protein S40288_01033 [Stachybotrys chartarum IBT 40288]